ncbi:hypothetical protein [Nocardia altamirensis]|uniref:hypothetical protein n=1 Tax=Nocardia altamirensis TaxID=472158 RepID=UPI00114D2853|nr:hypothetical protein [Nocardia altamirensis]
MTAPIGGEIENDPVGFVLHNANLPSDDKTALVADEALGDALIWFGQEYLAATKSEWDVALFFEVYGVPPNPVRGWSRKIISGLASRSDISATDRIGILQKACTQAVQRLQAPPEH